MTISEEINNFFDYEKLFNDLLGTYLIFSSQKDLTLKIIIPKIEENFREVEGFEFILSTKIINRTENSCDFTYYIQIKKEKYDILRFYFFLYNRYYDFLISNSKFVFFMAIKEIFNKLSVHEYIKYNLNAFLTIDVDKNFDRINNDKLKILENLSSEIRFSGTKEMGFDLPNDLKTIIDYFKTLQFDYDHFLEFSIDFDKYLYSKKILLYYLLYREIIEPTKLNLLSINNENIMNLQNPLPDPTENIIPLQDLFIDKAIITVGRGFPFIFTSEMKIFKLFYDSFNKSQDISKNADFYSYKLPFTLNAEVKKDPLFKQYNIIPQIYFKQHKKNNSFFNGINKFIINRPKFVTDLEKNGNSYPQYFYNKEFFGIIAFELPSDKKPYNVSLNAYIFNTSSIYSDTNKYPYIFYLRKSFDFSIINQGEEAFEDFNRLSKVFKNLFSFYPIHPYFFNRYSYIPMLYLGIQKSREYLPDSKDPLINSANFIDIHFSEYYLKDDLLKSNFLNPTFNDPIIKKIKEFYEGELWLWMMIFIEKWYYLLNLSLMEIMSANDLNYQRDKVMFYNNEMTVFKDKLIETLEDSNTSIRFLIDADVMEFNKVAGKQDTAFFYTSGLHIMFILDSQKKELKVFKLNCVSFNHFELLALQKAFYKLKYSKEELTFHQYRVPKHFFNGILVKNADKQFLNLFIELFQENKKIIERLHNFNIEDEDIEEAEKKTLDFIS